jgi:hypothetical protein
MNKLSRNNWICGTKFSNGTREINQLQRLGYFNVDKDSKEGN